MNTVGRRIISVLCLATGSAFVMAQGSSVYLSPTVVVMTYGSESASIAVRNDSGRPLGFKVQAFRWTNTAAGEINLESSDEIIVFPAALALQVGETRRIRVGTQVSAAVAAAGVERAYRVILDEIVSTSAIQRNALNTRMQFSLPVFVQGKDRTAKVSMLPPALREGALWLQLTNPGRLHVTPRRIEVRGFDTAGTVIWSRSFRPWYLLSGEVRNQQATLTDSECRATARIVAEAAFLESDRLALREERRMRGAGCATR